MGDTTEHNTLAKTPNSVLPRSSFLLLDVEVDDVGCEALVVRGDAVVASSRGAARVGRNVGSGASRAPSEAAVERVDSGHDTGSLGHVRCALAVKDRAARDRSARVISEPLRYQASRTNTPEINDQAEQLTPAPTEAKNRVEPSGNRLEPRSRTRLR